MTWASFSIYWKGQERASQMRSGSRHPSCLPTRSTPDIRPSRIPLGRTITGAPWREQTLWSGGRRGSSMAVSLGSERRAVQEPLIRYAVEIGWAYLSPEEGVRFRRGGG